MKQNPCFECQKRCLLCHAHCKEYSDWSKERLEYNAKIRDAKEKTHQVEGFLSTQKERIRKRGQAEWGKKYRETHKKG